MSKPIIEVEGLGKRYNLGQIGAGSLRDELGRLFHKGKRDETEGSRKAFWALRDVSFSLNEGEVLGVIGGNGAGKSTLLKLLSRITEPTEGRAVMRGRVASLLEVGTGFHQELSGRENIYLNGAVLGMTRAEVNQKFDEIIDFAGVEKFLDTPVKRYSSGMYVRLGFAVAAHLEPEILIVDEVLAVGDVNFQNKCIGKMKEVSGSGRTVLFVSHNLSSVSSLCSRGLLLEDGKMLFQSDKVSEVLDRYRGGVSSDNEIETVHCSEVIESLVCTDAKGVNQTTFEAGDELQMQICFKDTVMLSSSPAIMVGISDENNSRVFTVGTNFSKHNIYPLGQNEKVICRVPHIQLPPGRYYGKIYIRDSKLGSETVMEDVLLFKVIESDYYGTGHLTSKVLGNVMQQSEWNKVDGAN